MTDQNYADLEAQLCDGYEEQITLYTDLIQQTEQVAEDLESGPQSDAKLATINQIMVRIAELDAKIATARESWHQVDRKPGERLAADLSQLERLIARAIQNIGRAESVATAAKHRLEPKLTNESRQQRMAAAYGAARTNS